MDIFKDYMSSIENRLDGKIQKGFVGEGVTGLNGPIAASVNSNTLSEGRQKIQLLPSLNDLAKFLGLQPNYQQKLGSHPDFVGLRNSDSTENHYAVSMFVDLKGSTNLFRRYENIDVAHITNDIQKVAIHVFSLFGGYIHRLQGDGLFVYFGRKGQAIEEATLRSMQAASVYNYFIENDLRNAFEERNIERIYTRIGADLGYNEDVLWFNAGLGNVSEITTCSLHTSLASKMQAYAQSNGLVVGQNIKDVLNQLEYFTPVVHRSPNDAPRYIFEIPDKGFRYTQYDFDWLKFLKNQEFVYTTSAGELRSKQKMESQVIADRIDQIRPIAERNKPYLK